MGSHVYHEDLEGYDPRQIWHDGCPECEYRSECHPYVMISLLSDEQLLKAMERTKLWMNDDWDALGPIGDAELNLLRVLEAFIVVQRRLYGVDK